MNVFAVLLISIAFAACQKANDPVSPNDINKADVNSTSITGQGYSGNFEVTYKNFKNTDQSQTLTGNINFLFGKDTYSYTGVVSNSAETPETSVIHDRGTYSLDGDVIKLADDATKRMVEQWLPSLYLSGDYSYTRSGDVITIEGNGRFGSIKITLKTI